MRVSFAQQLQSLQMFQRLIHPLQLYVNLQINGFHQRRTHRLPRHQRHSHHYLIQFPVSHCLPFALEFIPR
jgi:hypothetical protein